VKIAIIGEGMLELSRDPDSPDGWRLGHGGDTLNTAIHLARLGCDVAFITALGRDTFSAKLRRDWGAEGLDVTHVLSDPERLPGLYAIETDPVGERTFNYWRSESAARRLFSLSGIDQALDQAVRADLLYFSLISLAVLNDEGRAELYRLCERVRAHGGRIAFDSNYRPRIWSSTQAARSAASAAAELADVGLPTLSDEQMLYPGEDAQAIITRWQRLGTDEVVLKLGADGCWVLERQGPRRHVPAVPGIRVVDTSGAGDAFNAGYLAARLKGSTSENAAHSAHQLAAWTIGRLGAIPQSDEHAPYGQMASHNNERTGRNPGQQQLRSEMGE
jgi:2-dehydro-3-deoxygluconokinase